MSRLDNIKNYKAKVDAEEMAKANEKEIRIEKYKETIRSFKSRIDELLEVGKACYENGIALSGSRYGGHESYDTHQFFTNGWSHLTGFYGTEFKYVGKAGGGACNWDLKTDGIRIIVYGDEERVLKMFVEQFEQFETEFYKYVDKVTGQ